MLAFDIGSKKVCAVEGTLRGGKVMVSSWGEIEYKSEVVANGEVQDRPTLSFLINEIIKTNRMKSKSAAISINSSAIIAREFSIPKVKPVEFRMLVNNEMARIVGNDDAYVTDYVTTKVEDDGLLSVTAYAMPRSMVEGYHLLLRELKLTPYAMDVHSNAMDKLISGALVNGMTLGEGNAIIADIGYSRIVFHGFTEGMCRFSRTELSPVQEFVRELDTFYRTETDTEHLKKIDLSPDFEHESPVLSDTCRYFISRLADEIQRYSQYLIINSPEKSVGKIYLCGGASQIKGLSTAISSAIKIAAEPLASVSRVVLPKGCSLAKVCNAAGALIRKRGR